MSLFLRENIQYFSMELTKRKYCILYYIIYITFTIMKGWSLFEKCATLCTYKTWCYMFDTLGSRNILEWRLDTRRI